MSELLRRIDLNLLVVLDALIEERSVTLASARLGMTQPAVSNALGRLRHVFQDPLFFRSGAGVTPTGRAFELAQPIREALRLVEGAVAPTPFDASKTERAFQLALSDAVVLAVLPRLLRRLMKSAPGVSIQTQPKALPSVPNLLDKSQVDLAAGIFVAVPPRFDSTVLFHDSYVCLMRKGHALAAADLSLATIATARHVLLRAVPSATARLDEVLPRLGLRRDVAVTVNQSAAIPEIVQHSDLIAVVLATTASTMPDLARRGITRRPLAFEPVEIRLVWHTDATKNASNSWLRSEIVAAAGGVR
jgi:DNA-binding transcriptional LysR family regulator